MTPAVPFSNCSDCARTIGSLSTYTTRQFVLTDRTTSWVLPTVGSPEPMSTNWRTPRPAIHLAARWWKPRLAQAQSLISGTRAMMRLAASRSDWKLFSPLNK